MRLRGADRDRSATEEARPEHRPREASERTSIRDEFETVMNCVSLVHVRALVESAQA